MNPLSELQALGQSIWVDDLRRAWIADGTLQRWIDTDGVRGITSNPAIFAKSIAGGSEYRDAILAGRARGLSSFQIYEELAIEDVSAAAQLFAPVHRATSGTDGFVSLEVSPLLADDTEGTLREARHLWQALDRPNVMIKVPATPAGVPAIRTLVAEGINVNVTLVFDVQRHAEVLEAFTAGLEQRSARQEPLAGIASVASFFISRIDTASGLSENTCSWMSAYSVAEPFSTAPTSRGSNFASTCMACSATRRCSRSDRRRIPASPGSAKIP